MIRGFLVPAIMSFALVTAGCGVAIHYGLAKKNMANLDRLSAGMTKQEVSNIMGTEGVAGAKNPNRRELFKTSSGTIVEVLYYLTHQFGSEESEKLTPVIFQDDTLVGIGWRMLEETSRKYDITIRHK